MRAVIQRVTEAVVCVGDQKVGEIGPGLVVLLAVGRDDDSNDIQYVATKIGRLRIFRDEAGKMNRSVVDVGGSILLISQFTLFGDVRTGNRPGFELAARPDHAKSCYEAVADQLRANGLAVAAGQFQASMQLTLCNDGPVTILLDSRKLF